MNQIVAAIALAAPLLQAALMGMIGYPLARRRPGGMTAFHRSGFFWWLLTLCVVIVCGACCVPALLAATAPSSHAITVARVAATVAIGLVVLVALEAGAGAFSVVAVRRPGPARDRARYDHALPRWASGRLSEPLVLVVLAVCEEAVYRGVALGGLLALWGASKPLSAGIASVAFGIAHWYYGARQVLLKSLAGAVLCWVALSCGWVAAAVVHASLNVILVLFSRSSLAAEPPSRRHSEPTRST